MANNYNPNNYNPYNGNYYAQKIQNLQGIREQTDKQIQDLQNMLQMQQHIQQQNYSQQQPQIQQTFQLSNPNNNLGDFDAKYIDSVDDIKNIIVYRKTLFINKDMSKLYFKDANGNVKTYELNEIVEKDEKDIEIDKQKDEINKQKNEIDELRNQLQKLTILVSQSNNMATETSQIETHENIEVQQKENLLKTEPVKKNSRKK